MAEPGLLGGATPPYTLRKKPTCRHSPARGSRFEANIPPSLKPGGTFEKSRDSYRPRMYGRLPIAQPIGTKEKRKPHFRFSYDKCRATYPELRCAQPLLRAPSFCSRSFFCASSSLTSAPFALKSSISDSTPLRLRFSSNSLISCM